MTKAQLLIDSIKADKPWLKVSVGQNHKEGSIITVYHTTHDTTAYIEVDNQAQLEGALRMLYFLNRV